MDRLLQTSMLSDKVYGKRGGQAKANGRQIKAKEHKAAVIECEFTHGLNTYHDLIILVILL